MSAPGAPGLRVAVVGVSPSRTCGVRDHAGLLAGALTEHGLPCTWHWLSREASSPRAARAELAAWTAGLPAELERAGAQAVVLHYSVFSYSYRGFPVFVRPTLAALRRSGLPLVTILHEFVYPWRRGGLRGKAWALSQALALRGVMRGSAAAVVTAPFRADWLDAQPWLPKRPVALAPVFSNLPTPTVSGAAGARERPVVGLFGYGYEGAAVAMALDAMGLLHARGPAPRLALLGAPGADSPAAAEWLAGARERGIERDLSFSGVLPAQELADELSRCDVLLHLEPSGPTSRKGTLAGSLASGTALVAIDGPRRWSELIAAEAALIVEPSAGGLADGVALLLEDSERRERLGAAGAAFAAGAMGLERSARVVGALLRELPGAGSSGPRPVRQPVAGPG
jgi:glycosyltransferase involved in cell wall biosynthesis